MNTEQFLSTVRTVLKVIGTALATHGSTKAAAMINSEDVIGVVLLLAAAWWSHSTHATDAHPADGSGRAVLIFAPILLAIGLSGGCMGMVTKQHVNIVGMTQTILGFDFSENVANQSPQMRFGYIRNQFHIVPTGTNAIYAPPVYSGLSITNHGFSTDIDEDFYTGEYVKDAPPK